MKKTATEMMMESRQDEVRFRVLSEEVARKVSAERRPDISEDVYQLLVYTAYETLDNVYREDAEVAHLKTERDHYKKLATEAIMRSPIPSVIMSSEQMATNRLHKP